MAESARSGSLKALRRIFITGATGFIGSHLTRSLLEDGYEVGLIRRKKPNARIFAGKEFSLQSYNGDIRESKDVEKAVTDFCPDAIIHLVAYYAVEHSYGEVATMVDTNVRGTINLLEASRACGVKLFVNTSTCAVYDQKDQPLKEEDPIKPQNLYAVTKLQAEESCRFYAENYGVASATFRLFSPYGPGDHDRRLIPFVIQNFQGAKNPPLTTGLQKWDYIYIDDVISAYRQLLKSYPLPAPYELLNLGTGAPVSVRDIVTTIHKMMNSRIELTWGTVPHRKNEVWFNSADISRAGKIINWRPVIGLEEGLKRTIDWYLNNQSRMT